MCLFVLVGLIHTNTCRTDDLKMVRGTKCDIGPVDATE